MSSLERSLAFYVGVLGCTPAVAPTSHRHGRRLDAVLGLDGAVMRAAMVHAGNGLLELHEYAAPPSPVTAPLPPNALGAQHVAFETDDLDSELVRIRALGWRAVTPVNRIDEGPFAGLRTVFLLDPDGIRVELVHVAYRPG